MSADIFINSGCYIPASGDRGTVGVLYDVGAYGRYYSGSPYSNETDSYRLVFGSGEVGPAGYGTRSVGRPVRCVAAFNK